MPRFPHRRVGGTYGKPKSSYAEIEVAGTVQGMKTSREKSQARLSAAVTAAVKAAGTPSEAALVKVARVFASLSEES